MSRQVQVEIPVAMMVEKAVQPSVEKKRSVLKAVGLEMHYRMGSVTVAALRSVDLEVFEGEFLSITGRSGSGKSTLLNLLAGLDQPTGGQVRVAGDDLAGLSPDGLADYRARRVGMVFQSFHLLPGRSALENVALPLVLDGEPREKRTAAAARALESVGLSKRAHHRPAELSGGEQQRVALARALVREPSLLLCDEPTGNLDTKTADEVIALLAGLRERRAVTVVMVTHEPELARRCADRIVTMADGDVVSDEAVTA